METVALSTLEKLGDYSLTEIRWCEQESAVIFELSRESKHAMIVKTVTCLYFQNLLIYLDFGTLCDSPLMWESRVTQLEGGRSKLELDFRGASSGCISLDAMNISIVGKIKEFGGDFPEAKGKEEKGTGEGN